MTDFFTPAIQTQDNPEGLEEQAAQHPAPFYTPSTAGERFGSDIEAAWTHDVSLARTFAGEAAKVPDSLADAANFIPGFTAMRAAGQAQAQEPRLSPKDLQAKFPGAKGLNEPLPLSVAQAMVNDQERQATRDAVAARAPSGIVSGVAGFGVDMAAGLLDPMQDAAFMIPVVGEARYASWLARAGESAGMAGRAGVTLGVGAARGAAGQQVLFGVEAAAGDHDLTLGDAAVQTLQTAAMGGVFHGLTSFRGDILGRRFAEEGQIPPAHLHDAATRAAAGQMADGQPIEVRPFFAPPHDLMESTALDTGTVGVPSNVKAKSITPSKKGGKINTTFDDAVARAGGAPSVNDVRLENEAKTAAETPPEKVVDDELAEAKGDIEEMRSQGLLTDEDEQVLAALEEQANPPKEDEVNQVPEKAGSGQPEPVNPVSRETTHEENMAAVDAAMKKRQIRDFKLTPPDEAALGRMRQEHLDAEYQATLKDEPDLTRADFDERVANSENAHRARIAFDESFRTGPAKIQQEHDLETQQLGAEASASAAEKHTPEVLKPGYEPPAGEGRVPEEHTPEAIRDSIASTGKVRVGEKEFGIQKTKHGWVTTETAKIGGQEFVVRSVIAKSREDAVLKSSEDASRHARALAPLEEPAPEEQITPEEETANVPSGAGELPEEGGKPPEELSPERVPEAGAGRDSEELHGEPGPRDSGLGERGAAEQPGQARPTGESAPAATSEDVRGERRDEGIVAPGREDGEGNRPERGVRGQNYRHPPGGIKYPTTPAGRIEANKAAIETLKDLEATGALATPEQQEVLARYVGWGGAPQIFDPTNLAYPWLRDVLTPEQYEQARASTINAHYTDPDIARAMWAGLRDLGFAGDGVVFEPGMGVGNFMGTRPDGVEPHFHGVELDEITGKIARQLYPRARIRIEDFARSRIPPRTFDAVIGNVPFANIKPYDKEYNPARALSLHNYFIVKSLHLTKPGGLMAVITSHYTMDAAVPHAREAMRDAGGDLVGAIRLPSSAFKKNAGTEVTTDILIFRKRLPEEQPKEGWVRSEQMPIGKSQARVNEYFHQHPENVLGKHSLEGSMYRGGEEYTVTGGAEQLAERVRDRLREIADTAPKYAADQFSNLSFDETRPEAPDTIKDGAYFVHGDAIMRKMPFGAEDGGIAKAKIPMVKRFIAMRDAAREVLAKQREVFDEKSGGTPPWKEAQDRLNKLYDEFVAKHGPINKVQLTLRTMPDGEVRSYRRYPNFGIFDDDPDAYLVAAIENFDEETGKASKAAIMTKRVLEPSRVIDHVDTPEEALIASMGQKGGVDLPYMERIYGRPAEDIVKALPGRIYQDPATGDYELAELYLSGNVRAKLESARKAGYKSNVAALEAVQPKDLEPHEILVGLGAPWIPHTDMETYIGELLDTRGVTVRHIAKEGVWDVTVSNANKANLAQWGTEHVSASRLIEDALNQRPTKVTYKDADGRDVTDFDKTVVAQAKQQEIKEHFSEWIWNDAERAARLARFYNDNFNNLVMPQLDGEHLDLPGTSAVVKLRSTQKKAVWRYLVMGNTLLDHVVGAGKTYTSIAAGMEAKRVGLIKKPAFVVPNHMLEQFSREFLQLYPAARILVASKEEMTKKARKAFIAKSATNDWDAVVMTHSGFGRVPLSPERQVEFIRQEIADYADAIESAGDDRMTVKMLEKAKKRREEKLKELVDSMGRDEGLSFEETGIDSLFVDEAHLFKNLEYATKIQGMAIDGSSRAFDLYSKSRFISDLTPGRGLMFMTGTPISNSMAEMFTMQRYLAREGLSERNLSHFDSWAAAFGDTVTKPEIAPDGLTARLKTRFAKFRNVPELIQMYRQFADRVTSEDLGKLVDLPKVRGGKAQTIEAPASEGLLAYVQILAHRADLVKQKAVRPDEDNMLKISDDGRKAALDMRLIDAEAFHGHLIGSDIEAAAAERMAGMARVADPNRKTVFVANKVHEIWEATKDKRLTQLIFLDRSTPKEGFNSYDDIKQLLIDRGVPKEDIAFVHSANSDEKKADLFKAVRAGKIRVLLGSTDKMGIGTNVQKRLVALHNVDSPWRPADLEQRRGRIERQGNDNSEVQIFNYVTTGSFDAYMWQTLERKARFINQVKSGDLTTREVEDIDDDALTYAEVKAIASGNPLIMKKADADAAADKFSRLRRAHRDQQARIKSQLASYPERFKSLGNMLAAGERDVSTLDLGKGDTFTMQLDKTTYAKRAEAAEKLGNMMEALYQKALHGKEGDPTPEIPNAGRLGGFAFSLKIDRFNGPSIVVHQAAGGATVSVSAEAKTGMLTRLENHLRNMPGEVEQTKARISGLKKEQQQIQSVLGRPFDKEKEYQDALARQKHIDDLLGINGDDAKKAAEARGAPEEAPAGRSAAQAFGKRKPTGWETAGGPTEYMRGGKTKPFDAGDGVTYHLPVEPSPEEARIIDEVQALAKKIVPEAKVIAATKIEVGREALASTGTGEPGGAAGHTHVDGARSFIGWALESGVNPKATFRHEAIHWLRALGFFKPDEWLALRKVAAENGWQQHFNIESRYPEAPAWLKDEESIAEGYGYSRQHPDWLPEALHPIFDKLALLIDRTRDLLKRTFGMEANARDIFSRIESGEIGRRTPTGAEDYNAGAGPLNRAQQIVNPHDEKMRQAVAIRRHLTAMRDIQKRQSLADNLAAFRKQGLTIARGIDAMTRGISESVKGARDSTAAESLARQNDFLGRLTFKLDRIPGAMDAWRNRTHTREWVRELHELNKASGGKPGITKSKLGLDMAMAVKDAQDMARYHLNKSGAWIGEYDGYVSRTRHNALTIDRAGFETWRDFVMQRLDQDRTFEDIEHDDDLDADTKAVAVERFLRNVWDALSTGVHISSESGVSKNSAFTGSVNIARRASAERVLHWKDADAWREYQEKFGDPVIERGVMDGLWRAARDTALMGRWGSNPLYTFETLLRHARKTYRDDHESIAELNKSERRLREEFAYLTGEATRPGTSLSWRIRSHVMAWQDITKLPFVLFTHLSVGATKPFQLKFSGIGRWQAYTSVLRNLVQDKSAAGRQVIENLRANAVGQARDITSGYEPIDGVPGFTARLRTLSMRLGGLPWMLGRQRAGAEWEIANFLGQRVSLPFNELAMPTQRVLGIYGLGEKEWDALRQAPDHDRDGDGATYLTPAAATRAPDALIAPLVEERLHNARNAKDRARILGDGRDRLAMKLAAYYSDAADRSVVTPGIPERAMLSMHAGRFAGPIIGQYKTWAMAAARQMWGQAIHGSSKAEAVTALAELVAVGAAMGYARMVITDALKGKEPRFFTGDPMSDIKIVGEAMAQGGGFGIFGDFLFGEFDRYGHRFGEDLAGPAIGDVSDALKIIYGFGHAPFEEQPGHAFHEASAEAVRYMVNHIPVINAFYIRQLANWLILNRLQEMASPGYLKRYQARVTEQTGQHFWLPPTQYAGAPAEAQ